MIRVTLLILSATVFASGGLAAEEEKPPVAKHGGLPRLVGDDIVELVQDSATGTLTIFLTGEDGKPYAIAKQSLVAQVKAPGASSLVTVQLQPAPQTGDPDGKTSGFAGSDPALIGKSGSTVILRIELDEKQQRVVFAGDKSAK